LMILRIGGGGNNEFSVRFEPRKYREFNLKELPQRRKPGFAPLCLFI
jgi:hypothetical protein